MLAYLWLIIQSPSSFQVLGLEPLKGFLKQARCSKSILLWSLLPWWRQPSRQHDAADFLLHLHQVLNAPCLQGLWQSYDSDRALCDEGGVCPLILSGLRDDTSEPLTSAQSHVNLWHHQ